MTCLGKSELGKTVSLSVWSLEPDQSEMGLFLGKHCTRKKKQKKTKGKHSNQSEEAM